MITSRLKRVYKRILLNSFTNASLLPMNTYILDPLFAQFLEFTKNNKNIKYIVDKVKIPPSKVAHKWVGAQYYNESVVAIPNDETKVLVGKHEWTTAGCLNEGLFKWTGGCIWKDRIYCYPRTANSFLRISDENIEEIPLSVHYDKEHHYAGVCTKSGVIYQPPRNTNHILKTDLKTGISKKIIILEDRFKINLRYCGSIIHPNGFIYFFPENDDRVIKLDPDSDRWCFIGKRISTMCFDAKIGIDGNIYGYSAYCNGIMKINVNADTVQMIHKEIFPGSFGTKYGVDGCLYSIPGDGENIFRFDVQKDEIKSINKLNSKMKAKYAGGVTTPNGTIFCIPAEEYHVLSYTPDWDINIPKNIYERFYVDNY